MSQQKKQVWVSPDKKTNSWKVKQVDNSKASKVFGNKGDALDYGKDLAIKTKSELIGQKQNGKINLKNSYGNDPKESVG